MQALPYKVVSLCKRMMIHLGSRSSPNSAIYSSSLPSSPYRWSEAMPRPSKTIYSPIAPSKVKAWGSPPLVACR